ncbi:Crp/Fnr family transcriptional regulator [Acaryochloris sp. IP29b_bin.137]|uniref:Crp/Fnr family transcriptional regulator n=1 Tax=Acaryochloris sp. IP29b_bin.137 TaxID=2969217 RepID=UPI00260658C2|nr:Crp/Fnr family transcriptional regulator [Acaryochloris sp. IP29b_bin.137]
MIASPSVEIDSLQRLHFKPRQSIPQYSDCLWHIEKGLVRTFTWDEEGDLAILGLWGPGDCVGQPLANMTPFQIESLCEVDVQAVPVSSSELGRMMRSQIRHMEKLFSINSYKRAPQRLLYFLDWLGSRFGQQIEQGRLLDVGLTHQLIAEMMGLNRITTTRLLNELARENKIKLFPKQRILLTCNMTDSSNRLNPLLLGPCETNSKDVA